MSLITQTSDYVVLPTAGPVRVTVLFSNYVGFLYPIKMTFFRNVFLLSIFFLFYVVVLYFSLFSSFTCIL